MLIRLSYDESWECNHKLLGNLYDIRVSNCLNDYDNIILGHYSMLNRRKAFLMPEYNVADSKKEDNELKKIMEGFYD